MSALSLGGVLFYALLLLLMLVYGANSFLLVALHRRYRAHAPTLPCQEQELPSMVVQLPVYNEENVVGRLIEAAGALEWPRERLLIQVLDDSTDGTTALVAQHLGRLAAGGLRTQHLRRTERSGFKAGALAAGLESTDAELCAIFDADFVPTPGFLLRAARWLQDPEVAAVQGRWTHLNRDWSSLTRAQALAIDGHFGVEQAARAWHGWLLNFNGTAGVWRRRAIEQAGGWSGETLTEDLDLSYRAQLAGWRLVYDPDLTCPAELPTELSAFKAQQSRWATGSMQTARKLLGPVWRSGLSLGAKLQATIHLTHYAVHPLIALTALLSIPCVLLPGAAATPGSLWTLLLPFALAMSGPTLLYVYAQRVLAGRATRPLHDIGHLTLLGIGIAVSNGRAVLRAFRGPDRPFVRTPKLGLVARGDQARRRYVAGPDGLRLAEGMLAAYCLVASLALLWAEVYVIAPFMLLDAAGFAYVARGTARSP